MRTLLAALAAGWLLAGSAAAQQQSDLPLGQGSSLADFAYSACTQAPDSEVCIEAGRLLRDEIIKALLQLGEGTRADGRDTVALYLDHPDTRIRLAAVAALGRLRPDASDTPALARLLNDPVPAVRQAALAALFNSSDSATIPLVDRAKDDQGGSLLPDPQPDSGWLGVAMPPGADPLRFTDDRRAGVFAFVSDASPPFVLKYFTDLTGRPALSLAELKAGLIPDWAKKPGMGFYQELGERMESLGNLPQDEMMLAQFRMALLMGMIQQGVEPDEIKRWRDSKLWGDPRFVVVAVDPMLEMPSQVVVVYRDLQLQRTGIAVQWLPAYAMPPAPVPQVETSTATTPASPDYDPAEIEATIWRAVAWEDSETSYKAYLVSLPNGAHAAGARAALDRLKAEAAEKEKQAQLEQSQQQTTEQQTTGEQTAGQAVGQTAGDSTPPVPSERNTVTTKSGITLSTASPLRQMAPVEVAFSGLDKVRNPWITIVLKGTPDNQWTDWSYTHESAGTVTLKGQFPGDYEIRAILENPREVVARLDLTVVSTTTGPPALEVVGAAKSGQDVTIRFTNLPGDTGDWIALTLASKPDTEWDTWAYTGGKMDGEVKLRAPGAGEYELRAYVDRPQRTVVARMKVTIAP